MKSRAQLKSIATNEYVTRITCVDREAEGDAGAAGGSRGRDSRRSLEEFGPGGFAGIAVSWEGLRVCLCVGRMRVVSGVVLGSGLLGGLVYWDRRGGDGVVYGDIGEEEEVRSEVRELESVVRDISRWERTRVAEEIGRVKKEFLERQLGDLKEEIGLMEHELEQRARWEGIRSEVSG